MDSVDREFKQMLTTRIQSYRDEEARLQIRIDELKAQRESVAKRRASAEELYEVEFGEQLSEAGPEAALFERPELEVGPLTGLSWVEAMTRVLEEAGEPLHVTEIWERLEEGGFRTDARDPVRSIVAIAVRGTRSFRKAGPNRYGLQPSLFQPAIESKGGE
jgi:hypothetical protein